MLFLGLYMFSRLIANSGCSSAKTAQKSAPLSVPETGPQVSNNGNAAFPGYLPVSIGALDF